MVLWYHHEIASIWSIQYELLPLLGFRHQKLDKDQVEVLELILNATCNSFLCTNSMVSSEMFLSISALSYIDGYWKQS